MINRYGQLGSPAKHNVAVTPKSQYTRLQRDNESSVKSPVSLFSFPLVKTQF